MRRLLGWFEAAATRYPRVVIAVLLVLTFGFGGLASTNQFEVDLTQLGREDAEPVQAMERVRDEFGDPAAAVQVIVDAGPGGNIFTADGLQAISAAEDVAIEALGADVRTDGAGRPQVISINAALKQAVGPGADDARIGVATVQLVAANPQLAALVSDDIDLSTGSARATIVMLLLDQQLTRSESTDAGERVKAAFASAPPAALADVPVTVYGLGLFESGMLDAMRSEAPQLFGLALLVVLLILALAYRSAFDVGIAFAGLVGTVIWTFGFAALLGPSNLGWTGPLSQLAVIVPVLLVGLGVDYSMHLTARYREERAAGQLPAHAAGRTLHTVGAALVLATVATATGFAATATAPLQLLADFGIFVAIGVVCAFTIMALLAPASRVLRDRRRATAGATAVRKLALGRLLRGPAVLARRAPAAGLVVAGVLTGASLLAAAGLETEFDRDDFIPEGTEIKAVLDHQSEVFGAGVTEATYVLIAGDLTDAAVAQAVWAAQQDLAGVPDVRTVGGNPQVRSVFSLAASVLGPGAELFTDGTDLEDVYDRLRQVVGDEQVAQVLAPDAGSGLVHIRTTAGDAGAERLHQDVERVFAPVEGAGASVAVTSEPIIIADMNQDLGLFQARSIGLTLTVVLALLIAYYAAARRRPMLGVIAMIPAIVGASLILGTMWLLGFNFNALTATLTAIAIGIGVPYGVHVVNRFTEDLEAVPSITAVTRTLRSTGGALTGSALTTLGALVVLSLSGLPPIRSLGLLGGTGIAFALLAAVLVVPGALVLWARRHERRNRRVLTSVESNAVPK